MKLRFCLFWLLAIFYTHCFLAGFLPNEFVYTSVGALELCNFKISDQVTSFNNMHLVCNDVVSQIQTKVCPISIKIYLSDTVLVVSPDQFFYLPARQKWIAVQDLQINDQLLTITGDLVAISMVEILDQANLFYNLTVKKNHNYFVSKLGVLAHNEPLSLSLIAATIGPKVAIAAGYAVKTVALGIFGYFCVQDLLKSDNSAKPVFPTCQSQPLSYCEQITVENEKRQLVEIEQAKIRSAKLAAAKEQTQKLLLATSNTCQAKPQTQAADNTAKTEPSQNIEELIDDSRSANTDAPSLEEKEVVQEIVEQIAEDNAAQEKQADEEMDATEANSDYEIKSEIDDLVKAIINKITDKAKKCKEKCSKIFIKKDGDYAEANEEFDKLPLTNIKKIDDSDDRTGTLPNGWQATVRKDSTDKRPTLEIQKGIGKNRKIKIRYGDK